MFTVDSSLPISLALHSNLISLELIRMGHSSHDRFLACLAVVCFVVCFVGCSQDPNPPADATDATDATVDTEISPVSTSTTLAEPTTDRYEVEDVARDDSEVESTEIGTLSVGDAAPTLQLTNWVKGSQVDAFEDDRIYVVEFWATWCGPCKTSMPHISQLQAEFEEDVTFIGISDETPETVEKFFATEQSEGKTWDEVANYTFAIDGDKATSTAYMTAAGQSGIPTAFIVGRDGYIEWVGHPMTIDDPIKQIVGNTWDRTAFAEEFKMAQARDQAMQMAALQLRPLLADEKWDEAIAVIDDVLSQFPDDPNFGTLKANLLARAGRGSESVTTLSNVAKANWENASMLNGIAWTMVTEIPNEARDLDLTLEIANRASELTDDNNPSILDTVAKVYYEQGHLDEAITWQEKAVASSAGHPEYQKTLDSYVSERDGEAADDEDANEDSDEEDSEAEVEADESDGDL
jgi:thiol-disulfide isomerase/thioredoxin